ncbi:MAG TPA: glycosyltransferase [Anaerolineae bacterium]|nr:glycosyltransferase [Anaerolineae bacterium]
MPVYNGAAYLREALDTLLAQDYSGFTLLISDDCSTDTTADICREYAKRDPRIQFEENPRNMGMMWNFNRVLARARTEYFMWAAQDDRRAPNYISTLLNPLQAHPHAALCSAQVVKIRTDGQHIATIPFPRTANDNALVTIKQLLMETEAGWGYGVYRTSALRPVFARSYRTGITWGWDMLVLLDLILNQKIIGCNDTIFYQRKTGLSAKVYMPKSLSQHAWLAKRFLPTTIQILWSANLRAATKLRLVPSVARFIEFKCLHLRLYRTMARRTPPKRNHARA